MSLSKTNNNNNHNLPSVFVDAHQHFIDTTDDGASFNSFLSSIIGPGLQYLITDYKRDVIEPITACGIEFLGCVHVEGMSEDGIAEAQWVQHQDQEERIVKAIVASCDLTQAAAAHEILLQIQQTCPRARGIRWILDVSDRNDQEYIPDTATHVSTCRHKVREFGTIDYLKVPSFEEGFRLLESCNFTFDLQCAPTQLVRASALLEKYPNIPVCLDHLGKLRRVLVCRKHDKDDDDMESTSTIVDENEMEVWKQGMQRIAKAHSNVYCKLSMLGCVIPNWHVSTRGQTLMRQLLRWVILDCFGPTRCMVALNWYLSAAISDSSGEAETGPSPVEWIQLIADLLPEELTKEQREDIFAHNAQRFYRF